MAIILVETVSVPCVHVVMQSRGSGNTFGTYVVCLGRLGLLRTRGGGGTSAARQGIALAAVLCCSGLAGTTGNRSHRGGTRQKTP